VSFRQRIFAQELMYSDDTLHTLSTFPNGVLNVGCLPAFGTIIAATLGRRSSSWKPVKAPCKTPYEAARAAKF
jgi:hypothetical protein